MHRGWSPIQGHIPGLDGLRGLACLAVFGVHWQQFTGFAATAGPFDARRLLENGNTGVSVLFTLSAFLLSLPFWTGHFDRRQIAWRDYASSRAIRIVPAYYACLLALAAIDGHLASASGTRSVLLHALFLHNGTERTFYSLSPPFWTIAVQAQSYVVMPLIALVVARTMTSAAARAGALIVLAMGSYALHAMLLSQSRFTSLAEWIASHSTVAAHTLLAHMPHFLLGMLAALAFAAVRRSGTAEVRSSPMTWLWGASVFATAIGLLLVLSTPIDDLLTIPHGRYNLPVVPAAIAWLMLAVPQSPVSRAALDFAPIRLLGVISYGVYVYHYPCMQAVGRLMRLGGVPGPSSPWLFGALSLLLSLLIATLSFRYFEEPLRRWLRGRRPTPATGIGA